jgi:hypothetical protein
MMPARYANGRIVQRGDIVQLCLRDGAVEQGKVVDFDDATGFARIACTVFAGTLTRVMRRAPIGGLLLEGRG